MNHLSRIAGLFAAALIGAAACDACDESAPAGATPASTVTASGGGGSTSTSTSSTATSTTAAGGSGGAPCEPKGLPSGVPDGWVEYTDWSCDCRFYVPGSKDVMPAPIQWEACPSSPGGIACQVMVADWTTNSVPLSLTSELSFDESGAPLITLQRNLGAPSPGFLFVNAEVDGPVRSAVLSRINPNLDVDYQGCGLRVNDATEGRYVLFAEGDQFNGPYHPHHKGAIGGSVDDLHPTVLKHLDVDEPFADNWFVSKNWVFRLDAYFKLHVFPWDMSTDTIAASQATDPEKIDLSQIRAHGDALFWTTATLTVSGINSWNPADGARPLVRFIGDATQGAGNLGTDGVDLVWSQGSGKAPSDTTYPVRDIMTAPFTTDAAELAPKRLRSDPFFGISIAEFQVGCGYAAHGKGDTLVIVRLSDGVSWILPTDADFAPIGGPIGLTCDEVFVTGDIGGRVNVARIKLDSLGPGAPPD